MSSTHRCGHTPSHDPEWELSDPDEPFVLEDNAALINYRCRFAETLSSQYSARWDETFHGYGEECGKGTWIRMEPTDEFPPEMAVDHLEEVFFDDEESVDVLEADLPRPGEVDGELVVEHDGYAVRYEP